MSITTSIEIPIVVQEDVVDPERLMILLTTIKLYIEELARKGKEA